MSPSPLLLVLYHTPRILRGCPRLQKELKKLAKAGQGLAQAAAAAGPNTPVGLPPTPGAAPPRTSTPQPGGLKPPPTHQQPSQARGLTPVGIGTPQSVSTPAPQAATPVARGVKREREDTGLQMSGNVPQGAYGQDGAKSELRGTKAGNAGVRPRPIKKARLVRHLRSQLAR